MLSRVIHSPFAGVVIAVGAALWQAQTTGGINEWLGLPFGAFLLAIVQSIWALVSENRLMKDALTPKLEIVFLQPDYAKRPEDHINFRPFLQTLEWDTHSNMHMRDRRYRIGVVNHSKGTVRNVQAVLVDCQPGGNFVFPSHRLLVQDTKPPSGITDVPPSTDGDPSAFFDVVNEVSEVSYISDSFRFCYSNPEIVGPVSGGYEYLIKIRVIGENCPPVTRSFRVTKSPFVTDNSVSFDDWHQLRMEAL